MDEDGKGTLKLSFAPAFKHGTMEEGDIRVLYPIHVETNLKDLKPYSDYVVYRRFKEFKSLYSTVYPMSAKPLPSHPKKNYFHRFDQKVIDSRRDAFREIMTTISRDEKLRVSAPVVEFLTPRPTDHKIAPPKA